jgi:hypothetical protein
VALYFPPARRYLRRAYRNPAALLAPAHPAPIYPYIKGMGEVILLKKADRADQTPRSFALADWREAIRRGGYWSAVLRAWVPVRMVPDDALKADGRERRLIVALEQNQNRRLSEQEVALALAQARALGEL